MPKISIIVPVYKVEKYLRRCVDSILNQTFTDFECILVDDGSPDRCGEICDEYAKADKRIKVIHKENGGLSDARNAGIDTARGEYLGFVDSDDWIHPNMYEILYKAITKNDVKLSACAYKETDVKEIFEEIFTSEIEIYNGMDFLMTNYVTAVVAWNKLYHRSLFNELRYPFGKIHEDEFTTYKMLYESGNIAYCSKKLYYYFINASGITKSGYSLKRLDALEAWEDRCRFFRKHDPEKYHKWAMEQLLWGYDKHYRLTGESPEFIKAHNKLMKRNRKALFSYSIKYGVNMNRFRGYYLSAFPRAAKLYILCWRVKSSYRRYGIINCLKKCVQKVLREDKR